MVQSHRHSCEEARQCLFPVMRLCRFDIGPQILKVLQLHNHCLIWQLLRIWSQGATEGSVYGSVNCWGRAPCHPGPLHQRKALKMFKDSRHPSYKLLPLLPHGKRFRCRKSGTNRTLNSFYSQAISLLKRLLNSYPDYLHWPYLP